MEPPRHLLLGYAQDPGDREYQEDAIGFRTVPLDGERETPSLVVLADGMGGHTGGKIASETAIRAFLNTYDEDAGGAPADKLDAALNAANTAIAAAVRDDPQLKGMGCTLIAIAFTGDGGHWISVGDSPMWLHAGGELKRINADHSMSSVLKDLVADGRMTAEEAANDPRRSALRSALTGAAIAMVDRSETPLSLAPGDCLVLASDGLDTVGDDKLAQLLCAARDDAGALSDDLVAATLAADQPGQDNVSVIVIRAPGEPGVRRSDLTAATLPRTQAETRRQAPLERSGDHQDTHRRNRLLMPLFVIIVLVGLAWLAMTWMNASREASEPAGPIGPGSVEPAPLPAPPETGEDNPDDQGDPAPQQPLPPEPVPNPENEISTAPEPAPNLDEETSAASDPESDTNQDLDANPGASGGEADG